MPTEIIALLLPVLNVSDILAATLPTSSMLYPADRCNLFVTFSVRKYTPPPRWSVSIKVLLRALAEKEHGTLSPLFKTGTAARFGRLFPFSISYAVLTKAVIIRPKTSYHQ